VAGTELSLNLALWDMVFAAIPSTHTPHPSTLPGSPLLLPPPLHHPCPHAAPHPCKYPCLVT